MYQIKKLIVCLDQTTMDDTLVQFATYIAKINQTKKIYFTNIIRNLQIPKEILKEFPHLIENMVEERKTQMKEVVDRNWDEELESEITYVVKEGPLAKKVLKLTHEKSADMILVGRKVTLPGSGV